MAVDGLDALLPKGPVEKARLTEAASPDTAPQHLHGDPVVDHLDHGDWEGIGKISSVHILDRAFADSSRSALLGGVRLHGTVWIIGRLIERRHINPFYLGGPAQELLFGRALLFALAVQLHHFQVYLFPVPQKEQVKKIRQRFWVAGAGAAGHHNVKQLCPVRAAQRDTGELEHIKDIGVAQFVLQGKADEVKVFHRVAAFQGIKRHTPGGHLRLHVDPGGENPFAPKIRYLVKGSV